MVPLVGLPDHWSLQAWEADCQVRGNRRREQTAAV